LKLHRMRVHARALVVVALLACAGCRRGPEAPVDPTHSGLPECPAGEPHLVIGLQALRSDAVQAIARYTLDLAPCRGAALPSGELGTISAVGALADGTDLVGFYEQYRGGGALVRVEGAAITAHI